MISKTSDYFWAKILVWGQILNLGPVRVKFQSSLKVGKWHIKLTLLTSACQKRGHEVTRGHPRSKIPEIGQFVKINYLKWVNYIWYINLIRYIIFISIYYIFLFLKFAAVKNQWARESFLTLQTYDVLSGAAIREKCSSSIFAANYLSSQLLTSNRIWTRIKNIVWLMLPKLASF